MLASLRPRLAAADVRLRKVMKWLSGPRNGPSHALRYRRHVPPRILASLLVIVCAATIAIWQIEFVSAGVAANPYLNGAILVGMAFGIGLALRNLIILRDDFFALDYLYEALEDARPQTGTAAIISRDEERRQRLHSKAHIFSRPRLLGSSFVLMSQEIARHGVLAIPTSTRVDLINEINDRIDARANFVNYVAGLMVMLGLLGTFVGLMETVGSVGTIIGELNLTGGAGVEAIQGLISNLRAPLNGMATGFSSSLFGLVASLIIGVIGKIGGGASIALTNDFELWTNDVARLESAADGIAETAAKAPAELPDAAWRPGAGSPVATLLARIEDTTASIRQIAEEEREAYARDRAQLIALATQTTAIAERTEATLARIADREDARAAADATAAEYAADVANHTMRQLDALRLVAASASETISSAHGAFAERTEAVARLEETQDELFALTAQTRELAKTALTAFDETGADGAWKERFADEPNAAARMPADAEPTKPSLINRLRRGMRGG